MKKLVIAAALAAAFTAPAYAADSAPAAAAAPAYSTATTDIGTLLDNPATKAVLDKNLPGFSANPQIDMARSMTLKQVQQFAGDKMTDEVLAKVDADLATIPAAK
jgi:opacity protein-like surface antigen